MSRIKKLERAYQAGVDVEPLLRDRAWRSESERDCLKASIIKWLVTAEKGGESWYSCADSEICPLCIKYLYTTDCMECPIYQLTERPGCGDTPYISWHDDEDGTRLKHAFGEVHFLLSLL